LRFNYDTSYGDGQRLLRHPSDWLAWGALIAALILAPALLPRFLIGEISYIFILATASLGLMVLMGFTGQVSLGPAAFIAIGAYVHAVTLASGVPLPLSLLTGALAAALAGLVIGVPAIRVSGLYLAMVTMAFAIIVEHVIGRWRSVTGGHTGLGVPDPTILGVSLAGPTGFYYLCLTVLALVFLGLVNVLRSSIGRAFMGVRDSEAASYSLGISVSAYKIAAFVLSSGVLGLAGGLMAHHVQHLTPEGFGLILSLELVLMVVIGGLGSLRGAILGAILIGLLPRIISILKPLLPGTTGKLFGLEIFTYGLILFLFVLFEPTGLNGRWLKLKALVTHFPLYRRDTFKRTKTYMKSERYR
jgi:branched-chain amino acid transport system permease protein